MANSDSVFNGQGETLDPIVGSDGTVYLKGAGDSEGIPTGNSDPRAPELVQLAKSATATRSSVNDASSDTLILAANTARKGATIWNNSTEILYLGLGTTTASATSCTVKLLADGFYEIPFSFRGEIRGIWAVNGSGAARVTELT